jgi:hypothetical protein
MPSTSIKNNGHAAAEPTTPQSAEAQTHQWFALRRGERSQAVQAVVVEKRDDRFGSNRQPQFSFRFKRGAKYHMLPLDLEWISTTHAVRGGLVVNARSTLPGFAAQRCTVVKDTRNAQTG